MATVELSHSLRFEATRAFRSNARFYAPACLIELLEGSARADELVLIVDIDTLERSTLARGDRVMRLALDALSQVKVQVVLVACSDATKAALLHHGIPGSWCIEREHAMRSIREQLPNVRVIAISDDLELLGSLEIDDRGIALNRGNEPLVSNVVTTDDISIRAVLWWLVDVRSKVSLAVRP